MNIKTFLKVFVWLIIGIVLYFVMETLIGEVVSAIDGREKGDDDMFPFYWLMVIVGGIIATTLTYVSWRKYRGERTEFKSKDNNK